MSSLPLEGKVALVTGASRGLGKAVALSLARAGARLVLASRDVDSLKQTADEISAAGTKASVFKVDVTQEQQILELEKKVADECGRIHILVNNAGMNIRKPCTEFALDEWRQVLETNLTSAFLMCRAFVPLMKGQGYGRILNMTSIMSHIALPGRTAYCASKAGLLGFTRALALELAPDKITVNGISPGPFATEINTAVLQNPELNQQFISRIPLARWGNADEVGNLAVYLCSESAGFITGTDLLIDGGWTAQ
ncbi:MAG TPA: SDR family NAD(P)-dependent oxidoreductase [Verrucomicrobiae bacterium]|nr:SDR family NAD(P)-dependent oxidoreductase [Verrucomicrobiae bacterium]